MVKYDPEFIAAKKKGKRSEKQVETEDLENPDLTWQQLLSRHVSSTSSEDFRGMSVFQIQPSCVFTSRGETCHSCHFAALFHTKGPLLPV